MESEVRRQRRLMDMIWDGLESDENGEMDDEFLWVGFEFEATKVVVASIVFVTVRF